MRLSIAIAAVVAIAGCSDYPRLDAAASASARDAAYPQILPLQSLLAMAAPHDAVNFAAPLPARAADLRRRARALDRPVIDSATRARMLAALARHAG